MKKLFLILMCFCFGPGLTAQTHLKNQRFFEFQTGGYDGLSGKAYHIGTSYGKYLKQNFNRSIGILFAQKELFMNSPDNALKKPVATRLYILNYGLTKTVLQNYDHSHSFGLQAQINLGYQELEIPKTLLKDYSIQSKSDYLLGLSLSPELQISNLHLGLQAQFNMLSSFQKLSFLPYLKYRFHL